MPRGAVAIYGYTQEGTERQIAEHERYPGPVYVVVQEYHDPDRTQRLHEVPDVYGTLELAREQSELPGPWEAHPDGSPFSPLTARGDKFDAHIYPRNIQWQPPHDPAYEVTFERGAE
ncbi:hypothetical protein [Trebonia sp.]|uniref:hypothetical protein n=1 Tax=Trebonia sp. TaxID=2767075 RepID=UPI00260D3EF8|nr:hypothetical protein [Trebonia sp.]